MRHSAGQRFAGSPTPASGRIPPRLLLGLGALCVVMILIGVQHTLRDLDGGDIAAGGSLPDVVGAPPETVAPVPDPAEPLVTEPAPSVPPAAGPPAPSPRSSPAPTPPAPPASAPARPAPPPASRAPMLNIPHFDPQSAWNLPVPANPAIDPQSDIMVRWLSSGLRPAVANLYEYAVPVWDADASTPRYPVDCTMPWGKCNLESEPVPIPPGAAPSPGSDGAMVILDHSSGKSYEFWRYRWNGGRPTASWGDVVDANGPGAPSGAVGAGVSRLAGVPRISEIVAGRIDHALVLSTDNACRGPYRYPASKSDGNSPRPDCVPEGARLQLDPSIDVDALELNAGERMVAKALQTYGAYVVDNGGARMAFVFEMPSGEPDPYAGVGFTWDYYAMEGIPWSRLRVLRNWDGG